LDNGILNEITTACRSEEYDNVDKGKVVVERRSKKQEARSKKQKNNTKDSNVVPHRSTNLARSCLTSLSRREAVLS
jgi:hypothetical protein